MIQSDITEFIDKDHGSGHGRIMQQAIEQGCFARSQKSGQHKKRDGGRGAHHGVWLSVDG